MGPCGITAYCVIVDTYGIRLFQLTSYDPIDRIDQRSYSAVEFQLPTNQ
jgi:hypothetical protein